MSHNRLSKVVLFISSLFLSSPILANKNVIHIVVDNHSHKPYSLMIYGKGANYEVHEAFSSLAANQTGNIHISYQVKDSDTPQTISHTIILSSEQNACSVGCSAHPVPSSDNYLVTKKLKAKLNSYSGPCQAVEEEEDTIRITITEETKAVTQARSHH